MNYNRALKLANQWRQDSKVQSTTRDVLDALVLKINSLEDEVNSLHDDLIDTEVNCDCESLVYPPAECKK